MRIAPAAIEALRAGFNWKVLSSHRHAINFVDSSGILLSFTDDRIRMGPFSIEVEPTAGGLRFTEPIAGITLERQTRVYIGNRPLDLASAETWDARPKWSALATIPWQSDFLPVILARLRASASQESLAGVVEHFGRRHEGQSELSVHDLPQAVAAATAVRVIRALADGDLREAAVAITALAGTGIGLTPSGDDFLVGVMFGVRSTLAKPKARAVCRMMYRASAGRTNRISQAWLAAAAEGHAIQAWHDLVDSILSRDSFMVDRASQDLIELGHTSGADALAGFVAFHLGRASPPSAPA